MVYLSSMIAEWREAEDEWKPLNVSEVEALRLAPQDLQARQP